MSITGFSFWVFAAIVTVLYFIVPKKAQWVVILCGNIFFYAFAQAAFLPVMLAEAALSYAVALKLQKTSALSSEIAGSALLPEQKKSMKESLLSLKKFICAVAVVLVIGVWVVLKYSNFFITNFNRLLSLLHIGWQAGTVSWILPLGISFYTFHMVGYVVDVYRGKYPAERNFFRFFTFVSFFPHIIQGPFSRYNDLGKTLFETHSFSMDRLAEGFGRILWGLFQKLVIADKLAIAVNAILGSYREYTGLYLLFAMVLYAFQIYADFAGYMDIICGLSHIWGIAVEENFRQPYFARTVDEFWRRWHITLGAWFKDYVFYPVSMGKLGQKIGKKARKKWGPRMGKLVPGYFALFFVWGATGLWHGADWKYLVWGWLNLIVILTTMQFSDFYDRAKAKLKIQSDGWLWQLFCILRTFLIVCLIRCFSVQSSVQTAAETLGRIFTTFTLSGLSVRALFGGLLMKEVAFAVLGIAMVLLADALKEKNKWEKFKAACPFFVKDAFYVALILMIILTRGGSADVAKGFMYAIF